MRPFTTLEDAIIYRDALWAEFRRLGRILSGYPKGAMGLTLDSIKQSTEYKLNKKKADTAFRQLREVNSYISGARKNAAISRAKGNEI